MPREALLSRTFVELADTLVEAFDVVDLLTMLVDRCVEVLDVSAGGLMIVAPEGGLHLAASSGEATRIVELFELQSQEGPCLDCFRTGEAVLNEDLTTADDRWPSFAPVALGAGFRSVHALPMRLRGLVLGALNLFRTDQGPFQPSDVLAAQALADIATIAILQHSATLEAQVVNQQLSTALHSRIVIEQAKGMLAERAGIGMDQAFSQLRSYARNHNQRLIDVAQSFIDGTLATTKL